MKANDLSKVPTTSLEATRLISIVDRLDKSEEANSNLLRDYNDLKTK